jgi:hypothetical protein
VTTGPASGPALDILADLSPRNGSRTDCAISRLREDRPDLAEQYDKAMATGRFGDRAIAVWITNHGFELGLNTISRHRRGECLRCQTS